MSIKIFNGWGQGALMGGNMGKHWDVLIWLIEHESKAPTLDIAVNNLKELDEKIEELRSKFPEDDIMVVLQDKDYNYIPIKYKTGDLKLALETTEEYYKRKLINAAENEFNQEEETELDD